MCSQAPTTLSASTHGSLCPLQRPFEAVCRMRLQVPSPLFLFSPNFLFSCLCMSTYFYINKTSDCVEDLLIPERAKQGNHRPVTLSPSAAKAPQLLLQACSRETHVVPACDVQPPHHTWAMGWIVLQWGSPSHSCFLSSPRSFRRKSPCWISPQTPQWSHRCFDHTRALTSE